MKNGDKAVDFAWRQAQNEAAMAGAALWRRLAQLPMRRYQQRAYCYRISAAISLDRISRYSDASLLFIKVGESGWTGVS